MKNTLIFDAIRTPRAKRKGKFSAIHPADLATYPIKEIIQRNNIPNDKIEDIVLGCVTQTGEQGWCIARQAVLAAGLPITVPATTINRLCGSGQQATNFVAMGIEAGQYELAIAGGVENMTRAPMFSDIGGEESPMLKKNHPDLVQQGLAAELLSQQFKITREQADEVAFQSQINAKRAQDEGRFKKSIVAVPYIDEQGVSQILTQDDSVRGSTTKEAFAGLKTVFKEDGIITAGNASAIVDGAATILLGNESSAKKYNLKPRARIVETFSIGSDPKIMLSGPISASREVLKRAGLKVSDIDIWEINEAFAPVVVATAKELDIDSTKINVNGGGISLGHPLGATGAMLIGTALDELERTGGKYALVTMCIGLGMGIATIIERV